MCMVNILNILTIAYCSPLCCIPYVSALNIPCAYAAFCLCLGRAGDVGTPGLHHKILHHKIFARVWVAQEPICS